MTAPNRPQLRIEAERLAAMRPPNWPQGAAAYVETITQSLAEATVDGATHVAASMLRALAEDRRRRAEGMRPEGKRRELTRVGAILDAADLLDRLREVDPEGWVTHL